MTVPSGRVRKLLDLNRETVEKFQTLYPGASLTWILDQLLEAFVDAHQELSPSALMRLAASSTQWSVNS